MGSFKIIKMFTILQCVVSGRVWCEEGGGKFVNMLMILLTHVKPKKKGNHCLTTICNSIACTFECIRITINLITVGQDIFADMIFSRILRILTKLRKYHVREYDFNDLFAKKV